MPAPTPPTFVDMDSKSGLGGTSGRHLLRLFHAAVAVARLSDTGSVDHASLPLREIVGPREVSQRHHPRPSLDENLTINKGRPIATTILAVWPPRFTERPRHLSSCHQLLKKIIKLLLRQSLHLRFRLPIRQRRIFGLEQLSKILVKVGNQLPAQIFDLV